MVRLIRSAAILLLIGIGSLYAQTQQVSSISSSYPISMTSLGSSNFFLVTISVQYPTGLTPGSYISGSQLNTDFQTLNSAYPNPQDPPEAIFSTILAAILKKYPQMNGGGITALLGTTIAPGVTSPTGGTISVVVGTYNVFSGIFSAGPSLSAAKPKAAPFQ